MDNISATNILKNNNMRVTESRLLVLQYFTEQQRGFTHYDIAEVFAAQMDRATAYRCLKNLEEAGILNRIVDHNGTGMYYLAGQSHEAVHLHPHFQCRYCGQVRCLPNLPAQYIQTLAKYKIEHAQFLLEGACEQCNL